MSSKRCKFSCDFETTTDPLDCRVWAYGYMQLFNQSNYKIDSNFDDFINWLIYSNADLYFHNLKFDGSFIVNRLLQMGYKWVKEKPSDKEFTTIISSSGQWYAIELKTKISKKVSHVKIYDSLKKLPFKVKQIAEAFNLSILKGDIDYNEYRPPNHKITEHEYKYIKHDIQIVCEALEIQFSQGLKKMTNGSDALSEFTELAGNVYEKLFPILDLELNGELRRAYRGGFTWCNPRFQEQEIKQGRVYDVNSLYPYVMYEKDIPCGHPIRYEGEYKETKGYPLYIQKLTCEFILKPNMIPTIQLKNTRYGFKDNEYLTSSKGERVTMYVSNVDWKLIQDHYEVFDIEYEHGYMFRKTNNAFKNYINKWLMIKNTSKGAIKTLAKLMLNSLYGKFATNPNVTGKVPYVNDDKILRFKKGEETFREPVYTPVGVFTTSYARELTIRTAQANYDRILYCDTDSIHLVGLEIPNIEISPDKLGAWKHEGAFKRAKFLRQKTYVEEYYMRYDRNENGEIKYKDDKPIIVHCEPHEAETSFIDIKCAGMPDTVKEKVTFENFEIGFTSEKGKLKPKQVPNGVVLEDGPYTLLA